ncbi:phosphoribosyltransferase family protein [Peptostreptococcaceae bacterium AGR-M142]
MLLEDKLKEECGVFGLLLKNNRVKDNKNLIYNALFSLQHRGEDGSGVYCYNEGNTNLYKELGFVLNNLNENNSKDFFCNVSLGHNRYSTCKINEKSALQPFFKKFIDKNLNIAIVHNGNLILKKDKYGEAYKESYKNYSDSRIFFDIFLEKLKMVLEIYDIKNLKTRKSFKYIKKALVSSLNYFDGSYAMIISINDMIIAFRDKYGFRPLFLAEDYEGFYLASETCAFENIECKNIREIKNNTIVFITNHLHEECIYEQEIKERFCAFEYIYFQREDSLIKDKSIYSYRYDLGKEIATRVKNLDIDIITGVPMSGIPSALAVSNDLGIEYKDIFLKQRYKGRSFIKNSNEKIKIAINEKIKIIKDIVKNKNILIVDDSLVRGITMNYIVKKLKEYEAKKIHIAISSPIIKYPCHLGINISTKKELIGAKLSKDEIKDYLGCDSLIYIETKDLKNILKFGICTDCFFKR